MKRLYSKPSVTPYGDLRAITGIFGGPASGDVLRNENGEVIIALAMSIDACAEQGDKCICSDNGTC